MVQLGRCFKPHGFGKVVDCSLHHFSNACENGYGQASYIRLVDDGGSIHNSLVMGKACVAPLKYISIPRMKLVAATLSIYIIFSSISKWERTDASRWHR